MSTRPLTPDLPVSAAQVPALGLAGVALVFMVVLATIVAPVIGDKVSEGRAQAADFAPTEQAQHALAGEPRGASNASPLEPGTP